VLGVAGRPFELGLMNGGSLSNILMISEGSNVKYYVAYVGGEIFSVSKFRNVM